MPGGTQLRGTWPGVGLLMEPHKGIKNDFLNMSLEKNGLRTTPRLILVNWSLWCPNKASMAFPFPAREKESSFCSLLGVWRPHVLLSFVNSGIHGDFGGV